MSIDLRNGPPRRFSETVEGIRWLPRLIDKARAAEAGTIGEYFYNGQSPADNTCLNAAGVSYAQFSAAVRAASDDAGVLAELERIAPGATARLQKWSAHPPFVCAATFLIVDNDEGYATGNAKLVGFVPQFLIDMSAVMSRAINPIRLKDAV